MKLLLFPDYIIKKPSLERKTSGNKTQATLIETATKLAMVGFSAAACPQPANSKVYGHFGMMPACAVLDRACAFSIDHRLLIMQRF